MKLLQVWLAAATPPTGPAAPRSPARAQKTHAPKARVSVYFPLAVGPRRAQAAILTEDELADLSSDVKCEHAQALSVSRAVAGAQRSPPRACTARRAERMCATSTLRLNDLAIVEIDNLDMFAKLEALHLQHVRTWPTAHSQQGPGPFPHALPQTTAAGQRMGIWIQRCAWPTKQQ